MTANWETRYRENSTWVFRLMFAKVRNRTDAEDLTTEVFLAALPRLREEAEPGEIRAYLLATVRTVLARHWRNTFADGAAVAALARMAEPSAAEPVERQRPRAEQILAALPERYRDVLTLRFLHAYSLRETASELGLTLANAKVIQHRALKLAARLAVPAS
jgi:RNA polymerase sigma-70 factor (ECF subfamily)